MEVLTGTYLSFTMNTEIKIIDFEPALAIHFEALNKDWIEKYFKLEEVDKQVLEHPREEILDHGGCIIFAEYGEKIIGTVALKKTEANTYEMIKMAVDENYRGLKIGHALAQAIIAKAKELGGKKLILYSNRSLAPAINLYIKSGFKEVPVDPGTAYKRCNIKMEMDL